MQFKLKTKGQKKQNKKNKDLHSRLCLNDIHSQNVKIKIEVKPDLSPVTQ